MKKISSLLLLLAAIIWGSAFVAQKATTVVPTLTLVFMRSIIAVVGLIPVTILFDRLSKNQRHLFDFKRKRIDITKKELLGGFLCGIFLFGASALQQFGLTGTDAGKTSFITALYVVIVPLYALFLGKKSSVNAWIGVGVAVIGFYLLCIKEGFSIATSDLFVFLCAFVFALHIMCIDFFLADCDGVRLSLVQFTTVTVISFASALIFESPARFSIALEVLPQICFLGIGSSCIAYTLQIIGQKNNHPAVASIILSLESVFGALFSAIILSERMTAKEYVGSVLILLAVVIAQLDFKTIVSKIKENRSKKSFEK